MNNGESVAVDRNELAQPTNMALQIKLESAPKKVVESEFTVWLLFAGLRLSTAAVKLRECHQRDQLIDLVAHRLSEFHKPRSLIRLGMDLTGNPRTQDLVFFLQKYRRTSRARCCSPRRSTPAVGGRFWRSCYFHNSLFRWRLTHSLNSAMCSQERRNVAEFIRQLKATVSDRHHAETMPQYATACLVMAANSTVAATTF